jgi:hypothetical protein
MSGITTSSQQEEKIKRAPPLPAKEDDALGSMDIDKVAGFIQEVLRRSTRESTVEKADHIKQLYDEAVISDRRQKVISNLIGSAITAGGTAGIASGISGKSVGSGLLMGGLGALSGAAIGSIFGGATSALLTRPAVEKAYQTHGEAGLREFIDRRQPIAASVIPGILSGGLGLGAGLATQGRFGTPWQDRGNTAKFLGKVVNLMGNASAPFAASTAGLIAGNYISDELHGEKLSSEEYTYMDYPHQEYIPPIPADNYGNTRQGLLYASSAMNPMLASIAAGVTANPGDTLNQVGRTMLGGIGGDAAGGLLGAAVGGPHGFIAGSYLGRPLGTYLAHNMD